jgi:hypothetical protein
MTICAAMEDTGCSGQSEVGNDKLSFFSKLVCAGCGVGAMQAAIGGAEPHVERLIYQPQLPSLPIWLAAPEVLRKSSRIKRVWDLLGEGLAQATSA